VPATVLPGDVRSRPRLWPHLHRQAKDQTQLGCFAHQKIGVREVSESIWLVSFTHYDLG